MDTRGVLEVLEQEMAFVAGRRPDPGVEDLVRSRAREVLHGLWETGELQGATPQEAYAVRCDGRTGTDEDRRAGRVVLRVALSPEHPGQLEEHTLVLETSTTPDVPVLDRPAAVAEAARLARERLTVVRRVDLATVLAQDLAAAEEQLAQLFEEAAASRSVLLLREADVLLTGPSQRRLRLTRALERLSRGTGVPYVLGSR
ncbi:hypothetical protein [Ornithinimicrobium tianjinense]|uniref:Uncharacterized protein n=1 Tax=Ornithinimicrobium tianjinense TaxID=1195761 RepID=A0A917BQK7_9MICO|nr:hypothetical protein [Ornithinimicrobium tianjinense]GGF53491.1 hypothetical protein GCM10011366_21580 [Ornithinimicrobium tianjinense]